MQENNTQNNIFSLNTVYPNISDTSQTYTWSVDSQSLQELHFDNYEKRNYILEAIRKIAQEIIFSFDYCLPISSQTYTWSVDSQSL